jgi:hypothetical protein
MFSNFLFEIVPFVTKWWENIVDPGRPHDNMAHERCVLDNEA